MENQETLKKLQLVAEAVKEWSLKDLDYGPLYIIDLITPILNQTAAILCAPILRRHQVTPNVNGQQTVECVHYTSINTVIKLLCGSSNQEKSCLRLYDSWHFNDPDEGVYFMRQAEVPDIKHLLSDAQTKPAYSVCFILGGKEDVSDNLLYWRMYGEEGEGCSLKLSIPAERLSKVLYGSEVAKETGYDLQQIYARFSSQILEALSPVIDVLCKKLSNTVASAVIKKMIDLSFAEELETINFLYKNDNFSYEKEVRFVKTFESIRRDGNNIKFDPDPYLSKARIRHYYEDEDLAFDKILTTDCVITIGPSVDDKDNLLFYMKELQRRAGLPGPEIRLSKVSYRKA